MRTLILSCNTGGGHNTCAKAVQQYYHEKACTCDIADALGFISAKVSRFFSWGHVVMYRHVPGLFQKGYSFVERHSGTIGKHNTAKKLIKNGVKKLSDFIIEGKYDCVICPHVFAAQLLSEAIRTQKLKIKSCFIATDYTCSPGASAKGLDYYFIPDAALISEFIAHGIPKDKIVASGIPITKEFYNKTPQADAKQSLGLDKEKTHLIMGCGSMGCGPMEELTNLIALGLNDTMELSVICGTNEKLHQSLNAQYAGISNIHIHGFIPDMSLMMDSADLFLTKPGGLSTTEAAAKALPMAFVNAVSGYEEYNLSYFLKKGCAVTAQNTKELAELCLSLLSSPARRQKMSENFSGISNGHSAKIIFEHMNV